MRKLITKKDLEKYFEKNEIITYEGLYEARDARKKKECFINWKDELVVQYTDDGLNGDNTIRIATYKFNKQEKLSNAGYKSLGFKYLDELN